MELEAPMFFVEVFNLYLTRDTSPCLIRVLSNSKSHRNFHMAGNNWKGMK